MAGARWATRAHTAGSEGVVGKAGERGGLTPRRRQGEPRAARLTLAPYVDPSPPAPVAGSGPKWPGARPRAPGFPAVWGVAGYHTRLPHFCFVAGRWRGGSSRAAAAGIGKEALHRTDWRPSPPNAIPAARESWVTCRAAHFGLVRRRPGKNCQLC